MEFGNDRGLFVFNGEIYNFRELAADWNIAMRSDGDTEVFGVMLQSPGGVNHLKGMYAAANVGSGSVRLVRDRLGMKPLYRAVLPSGGFAAASQLRCFRHIPVDRGVDARAVASFLRFGCVQGCTIWRGVDEVPPGVVETWIGSDLTATESIAPVAAETDLVSALNRSIARHLVSDVDVAVCLSAGIDSSVLALLASRQGSHPRAVTVASQDAQDESEGARWIAAQLGLRHQIVEVEDGEMVSLIDSFFEAMDQPSIDGLNTFVISSAIQRMGIKVALSGLGADELFGGYPSFRRAYLTNLVRWLPPRVLESIVELTASNSDKTVDWVDARRHLGRLMSISRQLFSRAEVHRMCGLTWEPPLLPLPGADLAMRSEIWRYMSPMLLRDSDTFSMANSVEMRLPYLDDDVVSAAIARSTRDRALTGKKSIVRAVDSPVIDAISKQPKVGFSLPMDRWMNDSLGGRYLDALSPTSAVAQVLDVDEARKISETGPWSRRWALLVLNEWLTRNGG